MEKNTARSSRWNVLGLSVAVALCTGLCVIVCLGADRELPGEEARGVEELESHISGEIEAVEKSFSDQVERMEHAFSKEVEAIEKELSSVVESLEGKPGDRTPLRRVPEIRRKIQDLAKEVERLKKVTESFPHALKKPSERSMERRQ